MRSLFTQNTVLRPRTVLGHKCHFLLGISTILQKVGFVPTTPFGDVTQLEKGPFCEEKLLSDTHFFLVIYNFSLFEVWTVIFETLCRPLKKGVRLGCSFEVD